MDEVLEQPEHAYLAYRASKTFAEKAAWDFVKQERPSFDLVSMNPPFVFGPTVFPLLQTEELNTSNFFTRDFLQGKYRDRIPETGDFIWVDVRVCLHRNYYRDY
jgi:nucleoside-diphosphate-sugar epimerase